MLYSLMDTLYKNGIDYWHVSDNIIILFFLNCIYYLQKTNNCTTLLRHSVESKITNTRLMLQLTTIEIHSDNQ